jgi:site-specific DNA recombinase
MNGVAMAVAVYLRVSTEEQRERHSIATQREFAERFRFLHELTVYEVYPDDGVTGTIPLDRRPEGSRMLRDAQLKKFDHLLVYKLDRLGRDTRLILNAVDELEKCGVRVRSMTEEFDTATPTGKLMLTMLSGFAAHEHAVIRERSMAGTNRIAQSGAWPGGIVPYGYRKVGAKIQSRLVISEEPISNLALSEAEVIRTIYRMAAIERKSCFAIADYLNRIGVPCAYSRDQRMVARGKRKCHTSGLWRPSRVRNLLVSTTYMGKCHYGKRSRNPNRQLIEQTVPPIVSEDVWRKAQNTLNSNVLFSRRNSHHQYLLRGLAKCGLCNLTYIGIANRRPNGKQEFYYRCNGKNGARGLYGANGQRCPSKDVNGDFLERSVWSDIEDFLRNPGAVIEQLRQRLAAERSDSHRSQERLSRLEDALASQTTGRDRILTLFRKGRITDEDLERQMDQIDREEAGIRANIEELSAGLRGVADATAQLQSTQALLEKLRGRLEQGVSWEVKRQLIEALVGGIKIETTEENGKRCASVVVTYRFAPSVATCTGMRACNKTAEREPRVPGRHRAQGSSLKSLFFEYSEWSTLTTT